MKNEKWDTRGNIVSYERDDGATITDYKQLTKSMGLDKDNSNSTTSNLSHGGAYASGEGTPGIRTIATSLMLLASLAVILILWIVAFNSESNLFVLTIILTFGILGWDGFVIFLMADDFARVFDDRKKAKEKKRKKYRDSQLNSLGRNDYDDRDII